MQINSSGSEECRQLAAWALRPVDQAFWLRLAEDRLKLEQDADKPTCGDERRGPRTRRHQAGGAPRCCPCGVRHRANPAIHLAAKLSARCPGVGG
jgi:hypothetical protein